jgi:hypothetical protein
MVKAKKLAAERNLDSGQFSFTTLSSRSDDALSTVLEDSCIVFNPARGSPSEILDLIRAKEEAQAAIAEAAFRKDRDDAAKAAREAAGGSQTLASGVVSTGDDDLPQGVQGLPPREADNPLSPNVVAAQPCPVGATELGDGRPPEPCQSPGGMLFDGQTTEGREGCPSLSVSMCTRSKSQRKGASRPLLSVRKGQNKRCGSK